MVGANSSVDNNLKMSKKGLLTGYIKTLDAKESKERYLSKKYKIKCIPKNRDILEISRYESKHILILFSKMSIFQNMFYFIFLQVVAFK